MWVLFLVPQVVFVKQMWGFFCVFFFPTMWASDPQKKSSELKDVSSTTPSTKLFFFFFFVDRQIKPLSCSPENNIWQMNNLIHLKHQVPFGGQQGVLWRRQDTQGRTEGNWSRPIACLLFLWLLICRVSPHQLSFAFEMLIYTSAVNTAPRFYFLVLGWANLSCKEPASKHFSYEGPVVLNNYSTLQPKQNTNKWAWLCSNKTLFT